MLWRCLNWFIRRGRKGKRGGNGEGEGFIYLNIIYFIEFVRVLFNDYFIVIMIRAWGWGGVYV